MKGSRCLLEVSSALLRLSQEQGDGTGALRAGRLSLCSSEETEFKPPGRKLVRSVLIVDHTVVGPEVRGQDAQSSVGYGHSDRIEACMSGTENILGMSPERASGQ